jgi:hypothetical protein
VSRRWSSRRLSATLGADRAIVRLLRRGARLQWTEAARSEVACSAAASQLTDVIDALDSALQELRGQGHRTDGLRCDVTVEDGWMVYEVIEGDLHGYPGRTADGLARAVLADTAVLEPDALTVRWQRQTQARTIACALPSDALQALQGVLGRHAARLGTVEGELVARYNEARAEGPPAAALVALPGGHGTQLGLLLNGSFVAVSYEAGVRDATTLLARGRGLMRAAGHEPDDGTRFVGFEPDGAEQRWTLPAAPSPQALLGREPRVPRLDLDLSPTRASVRPRSWVLFGIGAVALAIAGMQFQSASGQHRRESQRLQLLESTLNELDAAPKQKVSAEEARRLRKSSAVAHELQVPWARLFAALEGVGNPNVALLAIEPSPQRQELRIVAEAKTSGDMFDFLDALQGQPLVDVTLVSHQLQGQTPGTPIRFQARAGWDMP